MCFIAARHIQHQINKQAEQRVCATLRSQNNFAFFLKILRHLPLFAKGLDTFHFLLKGRDPFHFFLLKGRDPFHLLSVARSEPAPSSGYSGLLEANQLLPLEALGLQGECCI